MAQATPATLPDVALPHGWRVERHLATGGTAHVFEVRSEAGAPAILKWGRWPERDIYVRFELEAKTLRAIGPGWTPALYDHGVVDGWPYLVIEHIVGETLAAWMARSGERGGLGEILGLLDQLAAGLTAIHTAGVVHRDLKPENVLISPRGVRVIDFGLARYGAELGLTQVGAVVGTVHYLAPEQIRGVAVDHRADLYSFGVVAFEMLCGRPPFVGERRAIEYQHAVCRPPSVRETRAVPDELDQLIAACLAKQPEARPATAVAVRAALARAAAAASTARGVAPRALGVRGRVALLWIAGCDPVAVVRAVTEVNGVVARRRGDGVVAAFTGLDHDAPLAAALAAAEALGDAHVRIVLHLTTGLVRRSAYGKVTVYGEDLEHVERWIPAAPPLAAGVLLTAAAAEIASAGARPAADAPGWFRPGQPDRTSVSGARPTPPLVGRSGLIDSLAAIATQAVVDARPSHIAITGASGAGKSRALAAIGERLGALGHPVVTLRGERRFLGERPDDRLADALGGGDLAVALGHAAARGAVVVIDDAGWLPATTVAAIERALARSALLAVITASATRLGDPDASHRIDVALPPLADSDAEIVVRELLRPARLIPSVLIERLAIHAGGNPGLLVALASEVTRRGAVRRHAGSEEWYVAADELDTLVAAPNPAWFAVRVLEDLPADQIALVRACAALGPRFSAAEVAAVRDGDATEQLDGLTRGGVLREARGWYAFADPAIQDAICELASEHRAVVHGRAFHYWLARPKVDALDRLARLAFHGAHAGEPLTAATCYIALARAARLRGNEADADRLLDRALSCLATGTPHLDPVATRHLASALAAALGERNR
jgi:eukaryotic-like serine/threonine-protein kinase